jgi:hypothetical protein
MLRRSDVRVFVMAEVVPSANLGPEPTTRQLRQARVHPLVGPAYCASRGKDDDRDRSEAGSRVLLPKG